MRKLNGWKRIGIIASVVWILGAGLWTYDSDLREASKYIVLAHVQCDADLAGKTGDAYTAGFNECNERDDGSLALAFTNARLQGAVVGLVPVPLGWALVYLVLFLVNWVKRGFMRTPAAK